MRSIKYRAFYKGEMRQVTALEWIHEGEDLAGCYLTGIDKCVIVNDDETTFGVDLLEFTGLNDRNGTEIYEGDIIKTEYNELGLVRFEKGIFDVNRIIMLKDRRDWKTLMYVDWPSAFFNDCEVLGNRFENPELLAGE